MSTLMNIVNKKKAGEIKTVTGTTVYSKLLDEEIEIVKQPISNYMNIMAKHDAIDGEDVNISAMIPMMNELIFEFCPMFKEPDANKAAMEIYQVHTPKELPEAVFESNIGEMTKVFEAITGLYDMEALDEDIKN